MVVECGGVVKLNAHSKCSMNMCPSHCLACEPEVKYAVSGKLQWRWRELVKSSGTAVLNRPHQTWGDRTPPEVREARFPSVTFSDRDTLVFHSTVGPRSAPVYAEQKIPLWPHLSAGIGKNRQVVVPGPSTYRKSWAISANHSLALPWNKNPQQED